LFYFIVQINIQELLTKKIKRDQMNKKKSIKPTVKNPLIDKFKEKRRRYFTNVRRHAVRRSPTLTFSKTS